MLHHAPVKPALEGLRVVRKYFGTDGIRGKANNGTLTAELALKVGQAAGLFFIAASTAIASSSARTRGFRAT